MLFEKLTCAYFIQIALETMLLPVLMPDNFTCQGENIITAY
jgi:hypothetical protein